MPRSARVSIQLLQRNSCLSICYIEGDFSLACEPTESHVQFSLFQFGCFLQSLGCERTALQCIPDKSGILTNFACNHTTNTFNKFSYYREDFPLLIYIILFVSLSSVSIS